MLLTIIDKAYVWDVNSKGKDIELLDSDTVAYKKEIEDFETVLGIIPLSSGKYYWEIIINNISEPEDLFIGIAAKGFNLYSQPAPGNQFWGYIPCAGRKMGTNADRAKYGEMCVCNDIIGVQLELGGDKRKITFYRNQVSPYVSISIEKHGCGF
jgi:hypothetical protein